MLAPVKAGAAKCNIASAQASLASRRATGGPPPSHRHTSGAHVSVALPLDRHLILRSPARQDATTGALVGRRQKNNDPFSGLFVILAIAVAAVLLILKTFVSALAILYPPVAACCWIYGRSSPRTAPSIPDPRRYERPDLLGARAQLLAELEGWSHSARGHYEVGFRNGLRTTSNSGDTRFDRRSNKGCELNDRIQECESAIATVEEHLRGVRAEAQESMAPYWSWRNSHADWCRREAILSANALSLRVSLVLAVLLGFVTAIVGRLWPADWGSPLFYEPWLTNILIPLVWAELAACTVFVLVLPQHKERWSRQVDAAASTKWDGMFRTWNDPFR